MCPQRFGATWSSIWIAFAPTASSSRTVSQTPDSFPYPVSASTTIGRLVAARMRRTLSTTSARPTSPTSGTPNWCAASA